MGECACSSKGLQAYLSWDMLYPWKYFILGHIISWASLQGVPWHAVRLCAQGR